MYSNFALTEFVHFTTANDPNKNGPVNPSTGPWLPSNFQEKSDKSFENSNLSDAQQQLEGRVIEIIPTVCMHLRHHLIIHELYDKLL